MTHGTQVSFKSSKVQAFKVLSLVILSGLELLNPLNLEPVSAQQTPFYQGKTIRIVVGNQPGDTTTFLPGPIHAAWVSTSPAIQRS
jgi:hypothetical protein